MYKLLLKNNKLNNLKIVNQNINEKFVKLNKFILENNIKEIHVIDKNLENNFKYLNLNNITFGKENKIFIGINKNIFKTMIKVSNISWVYLDEDLETENINLLNLIKLKGILVTNKNNLTDKIKNNNLIFLENLHSNVKNENNENNENNINLKNLIVKKNTVHKKLYRNLNKNVNFECRLEKKSLWRDFCKNNFKYLQLFESKIVETEIDLAMVFIEFRNLPSNNFVVLNNLIKLGKIKTYIICCNDNIESFNYVSKFENVNFTVLNVKEKEVDINFYNNLLLTKSFWKNFKEESLLICQEDSIIFNSKFKIEKFLEYDYIGAPWPPSQKENNNNVGNGGFSLRKKSKILKVLSIEKEKIEKYLKLSDNVIKYKNSQKLENPPEDVYFSNILINGNLGKVASYEIAGQFSTELVKLNDSLGGHNWWLSNINEHCFEEDFTKIFNCVGMYSPFNFSLGGGEKYFSYIMKSFIKLGYIIIFFNNSNLELINKTLKNFLSNDEIKYIKILDSKFLKNKYNFKYYFEIGNLSFPESKGLGEINILHTQFPMNYQNNFTFNRFNFLKNYQYFILNSEFTKKYFLESIPLEIVLENNIEKKSKILYPPCDFPEIEYSSKIENRFLLIGRIFRNDKFANNKYHNVLISVFNKIKLPFELYLIGTCDDMIYLKYLKNSIKNKNIKIMANVSNEKKEELLKTSKYIISCTGMKDFKKCNEEHFGISLIEGINYNCIPLSYCGGYPQYFLHNDYLFKTESDLFNKINNILEKKLILKEIDKEFTKQFLEENFINNFLKYINNDN